MSLVINHNMMAMNIARHLGATYERLAGSTERLATGLRINSSADDAAGLAVSELMRADIAALRQGIRNAGDAQSMIQTADGALSVIDEKLVRLKELAEQAATGTYNSTQRMIMQSEFNHMRSEITRIAMATKFNGVNLLNGSLSMDAATGMSSMKIHFGPSNNRAEDYYYIAIGDTTSSGLGIMGIDITTQHGAQSALDIINAAITSKDTVRATLGAYSNRLANTITQLSIQAENLQAAESRVRDADIAWEMTEFVRNQILAQSGVAMLAQANMLPQMALQLIGG